MDGPDLDHDTPVVFGIGPIAQACCYSLPNRGDGQFSGRGVNQKMSGFNSSHTTILSVPLTGSLVLEAGSFGEERNAITILPPSVTMFDQLVNWLSRQAPPDPGRFSTSMIGIGATALCLRWGTYLAVLLDEHKPLDPRIGSVEISMISDSEMKRINLEFSANLARLIRMLHEDEAGCYRLLHLAHQHLAMTRLRPRQCAELLHAFHGLTSADFWNLAGPELKSRMEKTLTIVVQHPYRVLANSMALASWRNGPVENLHCGRVLGYTMDHRRATNQQSLELMRFTSERLATVLSRFRPWKQCPDPPVPWPENLAGIYISPRLSSSTWSLTESCSRIDLEGQ
jgi:hypothetical protein